MSLPECSTAELSTKAAELYALLYRVGIEARDARGYSSKTTVINIFCPGEIVADACAMARSTMYLKLRELKAAGLVHARAHYVNHKGRTRADGMCWAIRIGGDASQGVSVPYDFLKASHRCLSADVENGRTAWKLLKSDSQKHPVREVDIQKILAWALPQQPTKPVRSMTVRADLEQVLDVPYVDKRDRRTAVDGAARALATALDDPGGLMFWRHLLHRLLRLEQTGCGSHFHTVYEQARRAQSDAREGFSRNTAALLVSRLKQTPWFGEVMKPCGWADCRQPLP